jgi:archaeal cell division control protein 6
MLKSTMLSNENIFSQYINTESIFNEKESLLSSFIPGRILHREKEIQQMSCTLAPALKGFKPNNLFIYGTCGTGKTICTRFVLNQLVDASKDTTPVKIVYVNCKMKKVADTEYRLFAQFLRELGECVPDTGLPTDVIIRRFFDVVDSKKQNIIITLDEIDTLLKKIGDDFLYNLTRANSELKNSRISIVGITNDILFRENLDQRIKSSLSEEEILFRPYNALEIKDILSERVHNGFRDGVIDDFVLNKCAAVAAQEHGDARRALDLLRVAGEVAERVGDMKITDKHVDIAKEKIDLDRVVEIIRNQPKQSQAVLYSIVYLTEGMKDKKDGKWVDSRLLTGHVFDAYKTICDKNGVGVLTQRRVSDLIGELDMLGVINTNVISKGRYGRTREITLSMNDNVQEKVKKLLFERFAA